MGRKYPFELFIIRIRNRFIFSLMALTLLVSCEKESETKVIKLAHGLDITHPVHKAMTFMAERVAEKSHNTLKIKIYPSQQLGTERECVELLQIGSLGMTKVSAGVLENFAPNMKVFGLPFLFRDRNHGFSVMDGEIGQQLLNESEKFWLKGIVFYDAGSRSFYTKDRPVRGPEDLAGLKIRVMESASSMEMVKAFGGSPTPISWGELYTALQQGIVDGAENNPPSFFLSHHYEVCKYYTIDEHTLLPDVLVMSTLVWNALSNQEKAWLMESAKESVEYQRVLWSEAEQHALDEVRKAGVEIIYPEKDAFRKDVANMYEEFEKDTEMKDIIARIKDLR